MAMINLGSIDDVSSDGCADGKPSIPEAQENLAFALKAIGQLIRLSPLTVSYKKLIEQLKKNDCAMKIDFDHVYKSRSGDIVSDSRYTINFLLRDNELYISADGPRLGDDFGITMNLCLHYKETYGSFY
jgi:hypothetical protein